MTPEEKEKAPAARPRRSKHGHSVLTYLAILFAIAFLMLVLAFFMQQRSSENTISTLRESVAAMQTVESLQKENRELQAEVERLTKENAALKEELEAVKAAEAVAPEEKK